MQPSNETEARAYYDDFSTGYERERGRGYHGMIDDLEVEAVLKYARHSTVLEVGCGTGLVLGKLARIARTAKGVDLSPGMLDKAKERGLDVTLGSATDLPFADASFDFVCSFKVLAHVPDLGGAIAEMARVTKPGGHIAVELYNPWSLRYLAKRLAGPQKISDGRTEADVYTRWDAPTIIPKILPPGVEFVDACGVRVVTPAAFVHRLPIMSGPISMIEKFALRSPLKWFGGFLVVILKKSAVTT